MERRRQNLLVDREHSFFTVWTGEHHGVALLSPLLRFHSSLRLLCPLSPCWNLRCLIIAQRGTGAAYPRRADTVPALTRCGRLQQSPPGLVSTRTHRRSQMRRKAAQQCRRIATEVREVLELCRLDMDRVRSLWQKDRVAGIWKSLRNQSVATTRSTLRYR